MKVCHILLDRPWLYNRKVKYDGYKNTYSFVLRQKKVILQPMRIHDFEEESKEDQTLTMRCFYSEIKTFSIIFTLVAKSDSPQQVVELRPLEIQALLDYFADTTPVELPKKLPPTLDIHHAFNLIPSATLPYLVAYRMSPA